MERELKANLYVGAIIQLWITLLLRIIAEECHYNKFLCCLTDFRKTFDTMPRKILSNRLEKLKFPFKLRLVVESCMRTLWPSLGTLRVSRKKSTTI